MTASDDALADAWQAHWSRLIGLLIGQFARPDLAEDAVSDAFESAARHWPERRRGFTGDLLASPRDPHSQVP